MKDTVKKQICVSDSAKLSRLKRNIIAAARGGFEHIEVVFSGTSYRIEKPIILDAEEYPELGEIKLTLCAKDGIRPQIHSLQEISSDGFEEISDGIYKYSFPADKKDRYPIFRELYCDGKMLPIAKSESFIHPFGMPDKNDSSNPENERCLFVRKDLADPILKHGDVSSAELTMFLEWEWCNAPIGEIDTCDVRDHNGIEYYCVRLAGEEHRSFIKHRHPIIDVCNRPFNFTNHPALLTEGTYCYNARSGELYYRASKGENISDLCFAYAKAQNVFSFSGMSGITLRGISFSGIGSTLIARHMYFACQSNAEKRFGLLLDTAILTRDVRDLRVEDCSFYELGGNGIIMTDKSAGVRIKNTSFRKISMAAIVIGNRTTAWEDPKNRSFDVEISNNRFYDIGFDYPAAGAIYISTVDGLRILHNTIEKTAYSAITVGWGWDRVKYLLGEKVNIRDAEIAYNRITDFMQTMRDGAAIYVLGANCAWGNARQFNFMHDNYAEREMYVDNSKRGYYMDGSSTNWECFDNVILGVRLPIFSQFHVPDQYTHHNYIHGIYTDFPIDPGNHAPERDTIVGECFCVPEGKEKLFEIYEKAKDIFEASGCNW